jgi:hypothetical protein
MVLWYSVDGQNVEQVIALDGLVVRRARRVGRSPRSTRLSRGEEAAGTGQRNRAEPHRIDSRRQWLDGERRYGPYVRGVATIGAGTFWQRRGNDRFVVRNYRQARGLLVPTEQRTS